MGQGQEGEGQQGEGEGGILDGLHLESCGSGDVDEGFRG